jgi:hypothetical protein
MICDHCLRGKAQNRKMKYSYMSDVIRQYDYISCVTFTGGEPSLNPGAINDFIQICRVSDVEVGNFYIATNAKRASNKFMDAIYNIRSFCTNNEISSVTISNDDFHNNSLYTIDKLKSMFSFVNDRYNTHDYNKFSMIGMINQGYYAENYGDGRENKPESFEYFDMEIFKEQGDLQEVILMLNCNGKVILGCDWSYENQNKHKLCSSDESIFEALLKKGGS